MVVSDRRSPRDGRTIETIGQYNPQTEPSLIQIDEERARHWLSAGAQPTRTVAHLLRTQGIEATRPLAPLGAPMRELLEFLARALVADPDAVVVTEIEEDEGEVVLELEVADDDLGRVIGRGGRVANALRTVIKAAATLEEKRVIVDIPASWLLKLDVFTLFPEHFEWFVGQRHVRNAVAGAAELRYLNYRDTTPLSAGQVDDAPYGGGAGMVLRVDVVDAALEAAYGSERAAARIVALSPGGPPLRRGARGRARGRGPPGAALRALRGLRRARGRASRDRRGLDRALRPLRGRAGGDGGLRRRVCASCPARSATRTARSRSPTARRSRVRPSTRTTPARPSTGAGGCPEVLLSGDHARVREWRLARSRERGEASDG